MRNLHETLKANNLKKIQARLTESINSWDGLNALSVEYTRFEPAHGIDQDFNGDTLGMTLRTDIFDVKDLRLFKGNGRSCDTLEIYANLRTHPDLRDRGYFDVQLRDEILIRYRDAKGKIQNVSIPKNIHNVDNEIGFFSDLRSRLNEIFDPAGLERPNVFHEKNQTPQEERRVDRIWARYQEKQLKPYRALVDTIWNGDRDKLTVVFANVGLTLLEIFDYNFRSYVFPKFVNETETTLEIGKMSNSTYSSHPSILKFTLTKVNKGPKFVKLTDIDAEEPGYYSHDRKFSVRAEEVPEVKKFVSRFNQGLNNLRLVKGA
jgi:hypothetical protein